jgi:hypothetical protein
MATASRADLISVLTQIAGIGQTPGPYECPSCHMGQLSENDLHLHFPMYHVNERNVFMRCPICSESCKPHRTPFPVHLFNSHGPPRDHSEESEGPPLYAYGLVVCRNEQTGRYLLVQEFAGSGFWLPGGRVDPSAWSDAGPIL